MSPALPTSPASRRWRTAPAGCSWTSSARRASMRAARSAWRGCHSTHRWRSSWWSRGGRDPPSGRYSRSSVSTCTPGASTYLRGLLAPNPGPMTLEGTNTWMVGDPAGPVLVVDPGPLTEEHLRAVLAACPAGLSAVVLTHRHADHAESAPELARRAGCGIRAADRGLCLGGQGLGGGDILAVAGATVTVY